MLYVIEHNYYDQDKLLSRYTVMNDCNSAHVVQSNLVEIIFFAFLNTGAVVAVVNQLQCRTN